MRPFFVYIVGNLESGTLYIGSTDDLARRSHEHRHGVLPGFSRKYGTRTLLWYEVHATRESAFTRERQMKRWKREWKLRLIREMNPAFADLYEMLNQ